MWLQHRASAMPPEASSPHTAARSGSLLLPSFAEFTSARHGLRDSSTASWDGAPARGRQSDEGPTVRHDAAYPHPAAHPQPQEKGNDGAQQAREAAATAVHMRALTSSERGRRFRLREQAHEQSLLKQITSIREQIGQLESSRDLLMQRSLVTRTSSGGSLEKIVRELYTVYRFGLETLDPTAAARPQLWSAPEAHTPSIVRFKENFMRSVVDQDVLYGDLVGVDALLEQWRKHTLSTARFEIEIDRVEPIAGPGTQPIVVIHKQHARYSHKTLPIMFPHVLERRPDLARKVIGHDITFDCVSRFTFNDCDQITIYSVSINIVEALVTAMGSASDVAELMAFSVVTPSMAIQEVDNHAQPMPNSTFKSGSRCSVGSAGMDRGRRSCGGRVVPRVYTSEDRPFPTHIEFWRRGNENRVQRYRNPQRGASQSYFGDEESEDGRMACVFQV